MVESELAYPIAVPGMLAAAFAALVLIALAIRPVVGVAGILVLYPFFPQVPRTPIPGVNAETVLVSFALLLAITRSRLRLPPLHTTGVVLAFLTVMVMGWMVANTWVDIPHPDWGVWGRFKSLKSRIFSALLFFIGFWLVRKPWERRTVLEGVSAGILLAGGGVLADFALGLSPWRSAGFFYNSNIVGDYVSTFAVVPLYLMVRDDVPVWRRGIHGIVYAIAIVATVLTLSRASWLALAAGHFVWFMIVNRGVLVAGAVAVVLFATAWFPLVPDLVRNRVEHTFQTGTVSFKVPGAVDLESSAASRIVHHLAGYDMFVDSPVWGHGAEAFYLRSVDYGARYGVLERTTPHSTFLKLATENGILGLVTLGGLFLALITTGARIWRSAGGERALGALIISITIAQSVGNLFHTGFLVSGTSASMVWLSLGFGSQLAAEAARQAATSRRAALARARTIGARAPVPAG